MNPTRRTFFRTALGALAGVVAWPIVGKAKPKTLDDLLNAMPFTYIPSSGGRAVVGTIDISGPGTCSNKVVIYPRHMAFRNADGTPYRKQGGA